MYITRKFLIVATEQVQNILFEALAYLRVALAEHLYAQDAERRRRGVIRRLRHRTCRKAFLSLACKPV